MISFALEIIAKTSSWVLYNTYSGVKYMIYGSPQQQILSRIDQLENKLNQLNDSPDSQFYWKNKHQFKNYHWVVISNQKIICHTQSKAEALVAIAEENDEKCLLIQVGNEINSYLL